MNFNCSIAAIKVKDNSDIYEMNISDGTLIYSKVVNNKTDLKMAVMNSIALLKVFPEYQKELDELKDVLFTII